MKLIEWNIRHGGSKRIPGIIERLAITTLTSSS